MVPIVKYLRVASRTALLGFVMKASTSTSNLRLVQQGKALGWVRKDTSRYNPLVCWAAPRMAKHDPPDMM
jgi:hypothetical protein